MKKAILFLVTIVLLSGIFAFNVFATEVTAEGTCGENVTWSISGNTLTISGTGPMDDFKSIVSSPWFDYAEQVTNVIIEPGVTTIGKNAFFILGNVTSTTIPNTVTRIEESAYSNCWQLPNIDIPDSVTFIGKEAFYSCTGLTRLILPENLESCGPAAFAQCSGLKYVQISSRLTEMPNELFSGCYSLASITIPANVQRINNFVFENCENLRAIEFEGNAPIFDKYAFGGIAATGGVTATVFYPASNNSWTEETLQNYNGTITWCVQGSDIPESTFGNEMTWAIKDNTLYITGDGHMSGWSSVNNPNPPWYNYRGMIHKVIMSGNIQSIYSDAFKGCSLLTEVVFPSNLEIIFSNVFRGCISLEQIHIPESVHTMAESIFWNCYSLKHVTLPKEITVLSNGIFYRCTSLETVTVPSKVRDLYSNVFANCTNLKAVYFTGDMPTFTGGFYYPGSFSQTFGIKIYYPADNATWTMDNVQKLEDFYDPGQIECIPIRNIADFDKDSLINNNDVVLLLWHTLFPADYPLESNCDIDNDHSVNNNDVVLLLWHTLFPKDYPI